MVLSPKVRASIAGVLVANSAPHLATAVSGRRHLTPLAGRESSPAVNLAWAAANLLGGALLLRSPAPARRPGRWGRAVGGLRGWLPGLGAVDDGLGVRAQGQLGPLTCPGATPWATNGSVSRLTRLRGVPGAAASDDPACPGRSPLPTRHALSWTAVE
jgi:hypothetical protein